MPALAGLFAGLLLAATLPPWGWWPLGFVGAAVLVEGMGHERRWRLATVLAAGVGLYAPALVWMTEFSVPGYVLTVLLETLILATILMLVPRGRGRTVAFPAALIVAEAVRGSWPFGGLPLAGLDLGQAGGPLAPAARLGGHLLLVGLVGVGGVALAALARFATGRAHLRAPARRGDTERPTVWSEADGGTEPSRARSPLQAAIVASLLAVVVLVPLVGSVADDGSTDGRLNVAAVQGGGPRGLRAADRDPQTVFDVHLAASELVQDPVDLVLWPEDVIDVVGELTGSRAEAEMGGLAQVLTATVVAGVVEDAGPGRFRNAAVAWSPDGARIARYDKVRRVPFGEYVPRRTFVERFADLSDVPQDAIPGRGPGVLDTPAGRLGVVVSYEVFFPGRARAAIEAGGRLLLVPTNAASFRGSQVPGQELAAARLRALETGRVVVQSAPTGHSAVIDHHGKVLRRSPLGDQSVVAFTIDLRSGRTLASRLGAGPAVVLSLLVLVATQGARLWQRKAES